MTPPDPRLALALEGVRDAATIAMTVYRDPGLAFEDKADGSPVTVADRAIETRLRERIAEAFPQDGIVGEEFEDKTGSSGFSWYLDPIDGTKTFIRGVPLWGTMIGITHEERVVAGVVHFPALGETVYAGRGSGAWWKVGDVVRPARVSDRSTLSSATFLHTSEPGFERAGVSEAYFRLSGAARVTRSWGDCYGYLLVATGRAEIMVDPRLSPWDAAPLPVILEEAGGRFTDWTGEVTLHGGNGVATNGVLHELALAGLRG